jgi:phosphoglycerol transferase MdoB-like AlkP superfamily enzyme
MLLIRPKNTYSLLFRFIAFIVLASFVVRLALLFMSIGKADLTFLAIARIFAEGFLFDVGVAIFFAAPYALYLLLLPSKWNHSIINRCITYTGFFLSVLILMFSFFAEFTFWNEFESRFNFIAVDYLIYTYEVLNNINESYPLPLLISAMLLITLLVTWLFKKKNYFAYTFAGTKRFSSRLLVFGCIISLAILYAVAIPNTMAESSTNRYQNELAKAGIFSFFSAFKNNELNYRQFYKVIGNKQAFAGVRKELKGPGTTFLSDGFSINRQIVSDGKMMKPNVIMITLESFSADFMAHFGNNKNLTPTLDSLWQQSIGFNNMYATGTRTVRGMEALSLAIPPTPGNSIVRRQSNDNLTTVGYLFQQKGYETSFFYGGDGYFDNMNKFFGSNGFSITDRGRNILETDMLHSTRNTIPDSLVHFENAWGVCDEDLYDAVIRDADKKFNNAKPFYDFVMTTSNHRPFTYPPGEIKIPSGSGRDGAVEYTDKAIGLFLQKIKNKPWFNNTVIIFIADHCASSAGKNEIDIAKYHIPAMIYNLKNHPGMEINKMCSQIDLYPTLFHLLNWTYNSNLYGKNVLSKTYEDRILLGTYQKLAFMKNDSLVILSPQQKVETYKYNKQTDEQILQPLNDKLINEAIANYQTAYYLFKNNGLKQKS